MPLIGAKLNEWKIKREEVRNLLQFKVLQAKAHYGNNACGGGSNACGGIK